MLEKTVNFDDENSWEDFGIVFETMTIGKAEPQLVMIDVPFRNGSLDETDYFGDVRYKNRTITMGFLIPWWSDDQYEIFAKVQNQLNGKRKRITFSADEDWYYEGRLTVGDFKIDNGFFKFDITAICDPYKYKDTQVPAYVFVAGQGKNLFNINDITENTYLNSSAEEKSNSDWAISNYIALENGVTYTFNPNSTAGSSAKHCFYTEDKENSESINSGLQTFTGDSDSRCFVRFSFRTGGSNPSSNIQLEVGDHATSYQEYDTVYVDVENDYMKTIPTFITNVPISIKFENSLYNFSEGTHSNPSIVFKKGINRIGASIVGEIEGINPSVIIKYRQGRL